MKIDWDKGGWWRVHDLQGNKLGQYRSIVILTRCELVNTDNNTHGWLIVGGETEVKGETLIIK